MSKNLAILTGIFILPALFVCGSLAQENAEERAFEELQRQLWSAPAPVKARKLLDITTKLDSICSRLLQGQNDFSAKKAAIDAFYRYNGRNPVLCIARIDQKTSVIIYNISHGTATYTPIVNVFLTTKGKVRKIATLSLEKAQCPDGMSLMVPFQKLCILDDIALKDKKYIVLAGTNRIANYLVLIEMNWNKGELVLFESKYFNMWNASIDDRIRLESDGIIVRYPRISGVITEGWGGDMLLVEERICVKNGMSKTKSRKVLNPWYETVLNAVRLQRAGDREGFNKLCKAEEAWQLLSGKTDMSTEQQKKIDETKAIVVLAIMDSPTRLVFYVSKKDEKWIIVKADQEEG